VQAGGKSTKLTIDTNGNGGSTVQPATATQATALTAGSVNPRAGTIRIYWNISAGNTTLPVEIPNVKSFKFTADNSIVFTLKNGNTVELADYKGVEFAIEPAKTTGTSGWDLERTLQYGGCSYALRGTNFQHPVVFAAVHKDGVAFRSTFLDGTDSRYQWFPHSGISSKMWDAAKANTGSRLSAFAALWRYGITYSTTFMTWKEIVMVTVTGEDTGSVVESWAFNGNDNRIATTTVLNVDGSLTMSCKDINGKTQTHTFVNP
jgi:hypothetical protein